MYVVLTYDFRDERKRRKARRILRPYLHRVQLSVWEGNLTKAQKDLLLSRVASLVGKEDSLIFWVFRDESKLERTSFGKCKDIITQKALFL